MARTAGFHSGIERGILDDQGASASTHHHEMTHDRVFYETADGLFQLLVHQMAGHAEKQSSRKANRERAARLMEQTRPAHEAIATYMGIVYLETYQEDPRYEGDNSAKREYERLPPDYRGYYSIFGNLLDPYLQASWLRIAISWSIAHWAFSSPRLSHAMRLLSHDPSLLDDLPGPDTRLTAAVQAIANFGTAEWIKTILQQVLQQCEERGIVWIDIDDAAEWPDKTGSEKGEFTQSALFDVIREWLNTRVAGSRWPRQIDDSVTKLMISYGFIFDTQQDPLAYPLEASIVDARALIRAAERGRVHRQRPPELKPFDLTVVQSLAEHADPTPTTLTLLVNSRWRHKKYRAIARKGDRIDPPAMALNKAELHRLLRWRRTSGVRGPAPVIVCELNPDRDTLSQVAIILAGQGLATRKVMPPLTEIAAGNDFLLFNYIEQGFSGILEQIPGTAYTIDVHTTAADARLGVILFLPDDPELHACIRLLPRYDMGAYLVFQRALHERNGLKVATAGHLHEVYRGMIQAIIECWEPL